jgi:hypothetical protein
MNVPPRAKSGFSLAAAVLCALAIAGCERSSSGFKRDPKTYPVAFDFGYYRPQDITEAEVKEIIAIFEKNRVKAEMKLNNKEVKADGSPAPTLTPSPTVVPVANDARAASATPTPSATSGSQVEMLAGWKTQVCGLLQAKSSEDLEKALTEYFETKVRPR